MTTTNAGLVGEATDLIAAAKADLGIVGLLTITETDPLIKRAILTYCKANFGWNNPEAARLQESYEMLRNHLSMSADYAFFTVTFTVEDSATATAIRLADVTFNDETKTTNESGQAIFYCRQGNNYEYSITADGYESDTDNYLDVSASQTVEISLVSG